MKLHINIIVKYCFILLTAISLNAIGNEVTDLEVIGLELINDAELQDLIVKYYTLENQHDWPATYELRNSVYKEVTDYEIHKHSISRHEGEWNLLKITILKIGYDKESMGIKTHCWLKDDCSATRDDEGMIYIEIKFHEKLRGKLAEVKASPFPEDRGFFDSRGITQWRKEDGKWTVINPNSNGRTHVHTGAAY